MDDALLVGGFQGCGDLRRDGEGFVDWERPLLDPVRQRRPFDQLEDQCLDALGLFQPVDGADVGMVQRGEHLGLALEAGQPLGVGGERLGEHLERHVPVERGVAGLPDFPHAAFADLGGDLVDADAGTWSEGHGHVRESSDYIGRAAGRGQGVPFERGAKVMLDCPGIIMGRRI